MTATETELTMPEACARLGRSERTLHLWIAEGKLPSRLVLGRRLIPASAVEKLLAGSPAKPAKKRK
jgi:excisionase family DNA binding protein